jgi:hypothetical protein
MSAEDRFFRARQRIEDGQYDDALADLIWSHDNAPLESRAWSDVQRLLAVLRGIGRHAEAASLQALAIARIPDPSLRREVRNAFVKMPRAPVLKR